MFGNFAIKDCMDLEVRKYGEEELFMKIDFLNKSSFTTSAESEAAKKKGVAAVTFASGRTGELTLSSELINDRLLTLQMGGELDENTGVIKVMDVIPTGVYQMKGLFTGKNEAGHMETRQITYFKCAPQVDAELTFDAESISTFDITFDVMGDEEGRFMEMAPYVETVNPTPTTPPETQDAKTVTK